MTKNRYIVALGMLFLGCDAETGPSADEVNQCWFDSTHSTEESTAWPFCTTGDPYASGMCDSVGLECLALTDSDASLCEQIRSACQTACLASTLRIEQECSPEALGASR